MVDFEELEEKLEELSSLNTEIENMIHELDQEQSAIDSGRYDVAAKKEERTKLVAETRKVFRESAKRLARDKKKLFELGAKLALGASQ